MTFWENKSFWDLGSSACSARPPCLPCLQSRGGSIPLPAPACCQGWWERTPQNSSHFHQPWVKLRPGCYRQPPPLCRISALFTSILSCRGPPALLILPQCLQAHSREAQRFQWLSTVVLRASEGWIRCCVSGSDKASPHLQPGQPPCLYWARWSLAAHKEQAAKLHPTSQSCWSRKIFWCLRMGKQSARESLPRAKQGQLSTRFALLLCLTFSVVICRYI